MPIFEELELVSFQMTEDFEKLMKVLFISILKLIVNSVNKLTLLPEPGQDTFSIVVHLKREPILPFWPAVCPEPPEIFIIPAKVLLME